MGDFIFCCGLIALRHNDWRRFRFLKVRHNAQAMDISGRCRASGFGRGNLECYGK